MLCGRLHDAQYHPVPDENPVLFNSASHFPFPSPAGKKISKPQAFPVPGMILPSR